MTNPIFSIITIILSLSFGFFYVKPQFDITQGRRHDLAVLDETLKNTKEIEGLIAETGRTLDSIDPKELERFSVFLPDTTDAIRLANNIQRVAFSHRIALEKIKVENSTKLAAPAPAGLSGVEGVAAGIVAEASLQKYATTKTTLTFTTSDELSRSYLADLEKSLGLMNITALAFTPVVESEKSLRSAVPQYQYVVALETYSLN